MAIRGGKWKCNITTLGSANVIDDVDDYANKLIYVVTPFMSWHLINKQTIKPDWSFKIWLSLR